MYQRRVDLCHCCSQLSCYPWMVSSGPALVPEALTHHSPACLRPDTHAIWWHFSVNSGAGIKDNIVKWRLNQLLFVFSHCVYCQRCCRFPSCLAHVLRRPKDFQIIRLVWPATWLIAVAVVLSEGGNHAEEMRGGAAIIVTPLIPFRIAHAWQLHILSQFSHFYAKFIRQKSIFYF